MGAKTVKGPSPLRVSTRENGVDHGNFEQRKTWLEKRNEEQASLGYSEQPYCVIIGGGQGGIGLGARLRRIGVPTIIIEKNERPGDSWRKRYKSLCLHDPVWYDHLPYLPFPEHWPVFSPKDKIGDWLEMYTKVMELNYWSKTECESATFDESSGKWKVIVNRDGECIELKPTQLVLATGMSSVPNIPDFDGMDKFKGRIHHSSQHKGGEDVSGKKCVVIGSNNSAHDIAADLWEHGAEVTMVQRSSTHIAKSETLMDLALGDLYSEKAWTHELWIRLTEAMSSERRLLVYPPIMSNSPTASHQPKGIGMADFLTDHCWQGFTDFVAGAQRKLRAYIPVRR